MSRILIVSFLSAVLAFVCGCDDSKSKGKQVAPVIREGDAILVSCDEENSPNKFTLLLHASDKNGDSLTWSIQTQGSNGQAVASGKGKQILVDYTPDYNYFGTDTFAVAVSDGKASDSITVNVNVFPINDPPEITQGILATTSMDEDGAPNPFNLTLNAVDPDGDDITWLALRAANNGTAIISGKGSSIDVDYTPFENFSGLDTFVVQANDGAGGVDTITVHVMVNEIPDMVVYPTRVCPFQEDLLLVTDPKLKSVVVLDSTLTPIRELKSVGTPLGLAVNSEELIFVGDDEGDSIIVLNGSGERISTWAPGLVKMPNDMEFDESGRLFVVDSKSNDIKVFGTNGAHLYTFGQPTETPAFEGLNFPNAIALSPVLAEYSSTAGFHVYVSDKLNTRIAVFKDTGEFVEFLDGKLNFGFSPPRTQFGGLFGGDKFTRIQDLAVDATGMLHVLDSHRHTISILDPDTDTVTSTYGAYGSTAGTMNLPLGIAITATGDVAVTSANTKRVDFIPQN